MGWAKVGSFLKDHAPKLAGLLTNPVGTAVDIGVQLLSNGIGVDREPDKVLEELRNNPDALVKVKEIEADLKKMEIRAEMNEIDESADIIKTALVSEDPYVRRTRPWVLRNSFATLAVLITVSYLTMVVMAVSGVPEETIGVIGDVLKEFIKYLSGLVTVGFVGYTRYRSLYDKQMMAGKDTPTGVIDGLLKIMGRR